MLIENPEPKKWQELQDCVNRIFKEIGFDSEINKPVQTPRGEVEIDVYAIDKQKTGQIVYIVECKNWKKKIPKSVVHSFSTVMNETGGNVGYIITAKGLQSGAEDYTKSTNIEGITYAKFQEQYWDTWIEKYFYPKIMSVSDLLIQYTEPINFLRVEEFNKLSSEHKMRYRKLKDENLETGVVLTAIYGKVFLKKMNDSNDNNIILFFKNIIEKKYSLDIKYCRELLGESIRMIHEVTQSYHDLFGKNIFDS